MDRSVKGKSMAVPNPIPTGSYLNGERQLKRPASPPKLRAAWTATVLLSPFGDSVSPLPNGSQLVVRNIESSSTSSERWMRVRLYLTQDNRYFEFVFMTVRPDDRHEERHWYWIDSSPKGSIANIYGPFPTTLRVPSPGFFAEAIWGNAYPLMCTDTNQQGIDCDHWLMKSPGPPGRGSWYSFRRDTGKLFRILMIDSTNPLMVPIIGSYFIANLPTFGGRVSDEAKSLIKSIKKGDAQARPEYWNPMATQQDIQRAMAFPLASASCDLSDVAAVIPGFAAATADEPLPRWSDNTYAHGWSISAEFVPYLRGFAISGQATMLASNKQCLSGFKLLPIKAPICSGPIRASIPLARFNLTMNGKRQLIVGRIGVVLSLINPYLCPIPTGWHVMGVGLWEKSAAIRSLDSRRSRR
jgi:hypothetical protein